MADYQSAWTRMGFITRWREHVKEGMPHIDAFDKTSKEHFEKFGIYRYKNWEAFRNSYYSAMRNRKNNNL